MSRHRAASAGPTAKAALPTTGRISIGRYLHFARVFGLGKGPILALAALGLLGTVFEAFGLGMLLPVADLMISGGEVEKLVAQSRMWKALDAGFGALGLPLGLATMLIISFFAFLCRQAFVYGRLVYTARIQEETVSAVRSHGFRAHLFAAPSYHDSHDTGVTVNDFTTELRKATQTLLTTISLVNYILLVVIYSVILFVLSAPMTLTAFLVMLVAVVMLRRLWQLARVTGERVLNSNQRMSSFLVERLRMVRLVRLSGTEPAEIAAMDRLTGDQRDHLVHLARLLARLEVMVEPLAIAVSFVMLYVAVTAFDLRMSVLGLYLLIMLRLMPVMKEAMRTNQSMLAGFASLAAVEGRITEMETNAEVNGGTRPFAGLSEAIRFDNVKFHYPTQLAAPALNGLDLAIMAGRMTALVGPSGAGKSTMIDMLPRLRHPDTGRIEFDGVPIGEFDVESLRAGIAYVPQSPQIFNVSAAEHIRYGRPDATKEEIREAARLAGASTFIEALPDGFETLVGDSGSRLSGGQRQRLDLARGLAKRAHILILDEPTSNLDAESEAEFRAAVARIREATNTTIIMVGHRFSTIANADLIAVLDGGRVVESGTHADLVSRKGWYASAYRKQQHSPADASPARAASNA